MSMARIAVLGASGRTGRFVLDRALARGMQVKALARSPSRLAEYAGRLEVLQGDATDREALRRLVSGVDAVVSTLSTPWVWQGRLFVRVMPPLVQAMEECSVRRYVALSSSAAVLPTDEPNWLATLTLVAGRLATPRYLADKAAEVEAVTQADLEWTLLRPGGPLYGGRDGELRINPHRPSLAPTSRRAIATLLVRAVTEGLYIRRAPYVAGP